MRLILRTFYGRFLSPPQKVRRNFISISFIPENQYSILNYSAWRKWRLWRNGGEVSAIPPLPPHIVFIPSRLRLIVRAHWRDKTIESFRKKSGIWSMRELLCYKHFRMGVFFWKKFSRAEDYQLSPKKSHFLLILLRMSNKNSTFVNNNCMYIRESQNKLLELSEHWSIISVTGPRQSGKTTLCKMAFPDQMLKMYKNAAI